MKAPKADIPVEYIKQRFYLDENHVLRWKRDPSRIGAGRGGKGLCEGAAAGRINNRGYLMVTLSYEGRLRKLLAHRIVWVLTYGEWPMRIIDHINRVRTDNHPQNLRLVSHGENARNREVYSKTGVLGVYPTPSGRYSAQIRHRRRTYSLGTFDTVEEARAAHSAAAEKFALESVGSTSGLPA